MKLRAYSLGVALLAASMLTAPSPAQETNVVVQSMIQAGLAPAEAHARYALDLEARSLQSGSAAKSRPLPECMATHLRAQCEFSCA